MRFVSILTFAAGMIVLLFTHNFLPSAQRAQSNREAVWRLREAVVRQSSVEETRKAANEVLVSSKEMDVNVGIAQLGLRIGIGFLFVSAVFLTFCLKKKEPNQPLQRNASTGSVSNFKSPTRRG